MILSWVRLGFFSSLSLLFMKMNKRENNEMLTVNLCSLSYISFSFHLSVWVFFSGFKMWCLVFRFSVLSQCVSPTYKPIGALRPTSDLFSPAGVAIYFWYYMQRKLPMYEKQYLIQVRPLVFIGDIRATFYTCRSPYFQRRYSSHHTLALYESISCEVLQGPYLRFVWVHTLRGVTGTISQICMSPYLARCYRDHISDLYESMPCEVLQGPYLRFVWVHILRGVTGTVSQTYASPYPVKCYTGRTLLDVKWTIPYICTRAYFKSC